MGVEPKPSAHRGLYLARFAVLAAALYALLPTQLRAAGLGDGWRIEISPLAPAQKPAPQPPPAKSAPPPQAAAPPPAKPQNELQRMAAEVIKVTNDFRRRNGLPPFKEDPVCTAAAVDHARDMVRRGYFSHFTPEGGSPTDRYRRHNKNGQKVIRVTENLGRGNETTPAGALRMWLNSPGHRKHLVGKEMDHIGVGVARGNCFFAACNYYVQCFSNWPD